MTNKRTFKDGMFRALFNKPERMLELLNGIKGTDYGPEMADKIQVLTINKAVFLGRRNDLGFAFNNMIMIFVEHQSTECPNMPIRMCEYFGLTLDQMFENKIYSSTQLKIPPPEFYVFYNGTKDMPYEITYKLSDQFLFESEENTAELVVKAINICYDEGKKIFEKCETLKEYSKFVDLVNRLHQDMTLDDAVTEAVKIFKDEGLLKEFLDEYGSEVIDMLGDITMEEYGELRKAEGLEEGEINAFIKLVESGDITIEKAATMAEMSVEEFKKHLKDKA